MTIPTKTIALGALSTTKLTMRPLDAWKLATFDIEQNDPHLGLRAIRANIEAEVAWDIVDALTAIFGERPEPTTADRVRALPVGTVFKIHDWGGNRVRLAGDDYLNDLGRVAPIGNLTSNLPITIVHPKEES